LEYAAPLTVLFADLRDFTPMAEKTDPKEVIRILNGYFSFTQSDRYVARLRKDRRGRLPSGQSIRSHVM
jgi:class 3 adenylate cyclase